MACFVDTSAAIVPRTAARESTSRTTAARQTPIQSLDDLQPDPLNANRGTDRGREALRRSLHTYGAGRSIVIDTRGRILGGHKTVEQAKHLGLPITVVPTTGQELVVVQRVDLDVRTDPRAQELALADNRVAELDLDWDPAVLRQLEQAGVALEAFWTPEEFARLLAPEGPEAQPDENTVLAPPTTTTICARVLPRIPFARDVFGDYNRARTARSPVSTLSPNSTSCQDSGPNSDTFRAGRTTRRPSRISGIGNFKWRAALRIPAIGSVCFSER